MVAVWVAWVSMCLVTRRRREWEAGGVGGFPQVWLDFLSNETESRVEMDAEAIRGLLDAGGVKFTTQRYCVMAFLMETAGHPTATEIFDGVNRLDPRSSRATVYRNLRDLVDAGLVREVAVEGRSARFDVRGMRHHHFICDRCGEVEDMAWFPVPPPPAAFVGERMVRECEVILRGLCGGCSVGVPVEAPGFPQRLKPG
jgi:Fe2+ or Zn2+ uptake regulation protein